MALNKSIIMGRAVRDTECRWTMGDNPLAIARYTLAVDRVARKGADKETDFINCVAYGAQAEFAEKYILKGTKVYVVGRIRTGSYTNKDGVRVPTFEIVVDEQGFAESKKASENGMGFGTAASATTATSTQAAGDGFMNIPDGLDEDFPFP